MTYREQESAVNTETGDFQPSGRFIRDQKNIQHNDGHGFQNVDQDRPPFLKDG